MNIVNDRRLNGWGGRFRVALLNIIFNWILQAKAVKFLGTLRNQRNIWVLGQTFKVIKSKPYHPSYSGLVIGEHCLELWGGEGGCLGIWSSFLESLKLNKHPLKLSDNFNLSLCFTLSCASPRHCLLGYSNKVPMVLFPVPFLFLYIPARCVFGPLPSRSWWWAFCFFSEGELQRGNS